MLKVIGVVVSIHLFLVVDTTSWSEPTAPSAGIRAAQPQTNTAKDQKNTVLTEKNAPHPLVISEVSKSPLIEIDRTSELKESRDYFSSEWWLVYLTAALAAITGLLALYTARLFRATVKLGEEAKSTGKDQSAITKQMFLAENRPWILVKPSIGSDLTYDDKGSARVVIHVTTTNVGKGPAIGVSVAAKFQVVFGNTIILQQQFIEQQKQVCLQTNESGVTLFPGEQFIAKLNLPISVQEMNQLSHSFTAIAKTKEVLTAFPISLLGAVVYRFTFEEGVHQTGFIFDLNKRDPQNSNINLMIDTDDGPIPANLLQLRQTPFGIPPD
jgi:hypothetical protein